MVGLVMPSLFLASGGWPDFASDDDNPSFTFGRPADQKPEITVGNVEPSSTASTLGGTTQPSRPGSAASARDNTLVSGSQSPVPVEFGDGLHDGAFDANDALVSAAGTALSGVNFFFARSVTPGEFSARVPDSVTAADLSFVRMFPAGNPLKSPVATELGAALSDRSDQAGAAAPAPRGHDEGEGLFFVASGGSNSPPVAVADLASTDEDSSVDIDLLANDSDLDDDPLTATILTSPAHGTVGPTPDGIPGYFTYTPAAEFHGTDSFVYQITDGRGGSATATVSVTVNSVNDARLVPPINAWDAEGGVLPLQLETPDRTAPAVFSATGLPPGLSIDSSTGLITGAAAYSAAGTYNVTVSASSAGDTDSKSFTWTIGDFNRLDGIDDRANLEGDSVADFVEQLLAGTGTFSATGLPPGLSIDPESGLFAGTIGPHNGNTVHYPVTVTYTGGGATDTKMFTWTVLGNSSPHVLIASNGTLRPGDDITVIDPATPIPALVTLLNAGSGVHSVQLSVTPTGRSTLSNSLLSLSSGDSAEVMITPQQVSQAEDDVQIVARLNGQAVGEKKLTNADIKFVQKIRAPNTPTGMADRVPPRVVTTFEFTLGPALVNKKVFLTVEGFSNDNGDVNFKDTPSTIAGTVQYAGEGLKKVNVVGAKQTKPGNAGKLRLYVADASGNKLVRSDPFSVAAIVSGVKMDQPTEVSGADQNRNNAQAENYEIAWGVDYRVTYTSDSGKVEDLSEVMVREQIKREAGASGAAEQATEATEVSGFRPATKTSEQDLHSAKVEYPRVFQNRRVPIAVARATTLQAVKMLIDTHGNGTANLLQYFEMSDNRTGVTQANPVIVPNSGFAIEYKLEKQAGKYFIRIKKTEQENHGTAKGTVPAEAAGQVSVEIK